MGRSIRDLPTILKEEFTNIITQSPVLTIQKYEGPFGLYMLNNAAQARMQKKERRR